MKRFQLLLLIVGLVFSLSAQDLAESKIKLDCKVDVNLGTGYTTSKVFVLNNEQFLFSHNSKTGQTTVWNLNKGGQPVHEAKWSTGWTNIEFYEFKGEVYFFHQKGEEGTARINKLDYNSIMTNKSMGSKVFEQKWSAGWTATKFFVHNDILYFLHYKKGTGQAKLNASTTGSSVGKTIYEKNWSEGYTNFAMTAHGENFYILYQKGDEGTCVINNVNLEKLEAAAKAGLVSPNLGVEAYRKKWSTGWSNFCFFSLNNEVYLFFNKPNEGTVRIEKLNTDGTLGTRVYDSKWSTGWSEIDIFNMSGISYLFHQKADSGKTKICALKF